jgi:hypothetical protein
MSGADTDDAGIRAATVSTMPCRTDGRAIDSSRSAPSAVTHGMAAEQVPDAGPEQGLLSVEAPAFVIASAAPGAVTFSAVMPPMPGMVAIGLGGSALTAPAIGCMPGTTHTTPPATIVR